MNTRLLRNPLVVATMVSALSVVALALPPQQSKWAAANDPAAKYIIDRERQWAESGCTQQLAADIFADEFEGTAPDGSRYDKSQALKPEAGVIETACRLDDVKVRLFTDSLAMAYGNERSTRKVQGQPEAVRCLVWTDTWLKRDGKWELIAAQDTAVPCKSAR
jgi:hypothetical protein